MDADFDLLCADLFNGDFDQFAATFDFEEFEESQTRKVASAEIKNVSRPATINNNSNNDNNNHSNNTTSDNNTNTNTNTNTVLSAGSKRGHAEMTTGETSDMSSVSSAETTSSSNHPSDANKTVKTDEAMKDQRLQAISELIHALNQCENEAIERLLQDSYEENVVVKLHHLGVEDVYTARNALLLIWTATHEAYPDGMYKVLEKRYVNMTVPRNKNANPNSSTTTTNNNTNNNDNNNINSSANAMCRVASPQVEFVYKFSGTKIMPGNLTTLIQRFAAAHPDYATYDGPEKLSDKLLQFVALQQQQGGGGERGVFFEAETADHFIGEATLTFSPDSLRVKEVTFNVLAFDSR